MYETSFYFCRLNFKKFHARYSALQRTYIYRIISGNKFGFPFENGSWWFINKKLNIEMMKEACRILLECRDFTSLKLPKDLSNPIRTVDEILLSEEPISQFKFWTEEKSLENNQIISIKTKSRSYMTHQVRKMVGVIVACGKGLISPIQIINFLNDHDPSKCPLMAPPHGLYLKEVIYDEKDYKILEKSE